jgi:hypothetical protein
MINCAGCVDDGSDGALWQLGEKLATPSPPADVRHACHRAACWLRLRVWRTVRDDLEQRLPGTQAAELVRGSSADAGAGGVHLPWRARAMPPAAAFSFAKLQADGHHCLACVSPQSVNVGRARKKYGACTDP